MLKSLRLVQFRNYLDQTFELAPITIFSGENGAGKTNILEAVRLLSVGKTWRQVTDRDLIMWEKPYSRVEGVMTNDRTEQYGVVIEGDGRGGKKTFLHNGVTLPLSRYYGSITTVLFTPETLHLIDGPPAERRRWLDAFLGQLDRQYLEALLTYRQVIRERRFLLKRIARRESQERELEYWDETLIKTGGRLIEERQRLIALLDESVPLIDRQFGRERRVTLQYQPSVTMSDLRDALIAHRSIDIRLAATTVGPHRDDILFLQDNRDIRTSGSRGERRRLVLALKLAEAAHMVSLSFQPIVLLDDVFSEFDVQLQASVAHSFGQYQAIVTTTDDKFPGHKELKETRMIRVPVL